MDERERLRIESFEERERAARDWAAGIVRRIVDLVVEYNARPRFAEMVSRWDARCRARIKQLSPVCLLYTGGERPYPIDLPEMYTALAAFHDGFSVSSAPLGPVDFSFCEQWYMGWYSVESAPKSYFKGKPVHLSVAAPMALFPKGDGALREMISVVKHDLAEWSSTQPLCAQTLPTVQASEDDKPDTTNGEELSRPMAKVKMMAALRIESYKTFNAFAKRQGIRFAGNRQTWQLRLKGLREDQKDRLRGRLRRN